MSLYACTETVYEIEFSFFYTQDGHSAGAPIESCPSSSCLISWAGFNVERRIISSANMPRFRNFDITLVMSFEHA